MSSPRRRRQQDTSSNDDDGTNKEIEPMDEIEQAKLVKKMRQDAMAQMELIHNIFSRVCEAAMVLCLVLGVAAQDMWGWVHVVLSIGLHWGASSMANMAVAANTTTTTSSSSAIQKVLPIITLLTVLMILPKTFRGSQSMSSNTNDDDHSHHLGLAISNVVTMLGAMYLKHDGHTTMKSIEELENSKYSHKTL